MRAVLRDLLALYQLLEHWHWEGHASELRLEVLIDEVVAVVELEDASWLEVGERLHVLFGRLHIESHVLDDLVQSQLLTEIEQV